MESETGRRRLRATLAGVAGDCLSSFLPRPNLGAIYGRAGIEVAASPVGACCVLVLDKGNSVETARSGRKATGASIASAFDDKPGCRRDAALTNAAAWKQRGETRVDVT